MIFNKVYEEVRTAGHKRTIHTEKRTIYADEKMHKKNQVTAPPVQKDDIHLKDYKKAIKGKGQYSVWINNTVNKI